MNLSRRVFLDNTVWAAAAVLASGGARPTQADEPAAKRVGPGDKIRVAVIGVNGQGGGHIAEWLKNPEVDLVAVCDCDPAAYQKHQGKYKGLKRPPRYEQ